MIFEIFIFESTSNYDYLLLIILYIIVASYNKNTKKSLGIIMIIICVTCLYGCESDQKDRTKIINA